MTWCPDALVTDGLSRSPMQIAALSCVIWHERLLVALIQQNLAL